MPLPWLPVHVGGGKQPTTSTHPSRFRPYRECQRTVLRVSDETRDKVLRIGREEFGGASADETIRRLLDEHWRAPAVEAVRLSQETDPQGWADYLTEAGEWESVQAPVAE